MFSKAWPKQQSRNEKGKGSARLHRHSKSLLLLSTRYINPDRPFLTQNQEIGKFLWSQLIDWFWCSEIREGVGRDRKDRFQIDPWGAALASIHSFLWPFLEAKICARWFSFFLSSIEQNLGHTPLKKNEKVGGRYKYCLSFNFFYYYLLTSNRIYIGKRLDLPIVFFLVWRDFEVSLKGQISPSPQATMLIALQQHSPLLRKFYPSEDWLSSRCVTSVIARELVLFPSWHQPPTLNWNV